MIKEVFMGEMFLCPANAAALPAAVVTWHIFFKYTVILKLNLHLTRIVVSAQEPLLLAPTTKSMIEIQDCSTEQ